jgi:hypothetical protein
MTDQEIDALYGLPLAEFTNARNELAAELRSRGERDAAAEVRKLAKPTAAAWAVNQVMRTQRKDARALLEAGERLRKAHEDAASGKGSADDLRIAVTGERVAVERLSQAARGLTDANGRDLSESVLERVKQTLHAIAADSEARSLATAGRLSKERQATAATAFAVPPGKGRAASRGRPSKVQIQKARERVQRAQREARDLRSARTQAARAASHAEQALTRARADVRAADRKVAEKEGEVEELRRKLDELR